MALEIQLHGKDSQPAASWGLVGWFVWLFFPKVKPVLSPMGVFAAFLKSQVMGLVPSVMDMLHPILGRHGHQHRLHDRRQAPQQESVQRELPIFPSQGQGKAIPSCPSEASPAGQEPSAPGMATGPHPSVFGLGGFESDF